MIKSRLLYAALLCAVCMLNIIPFVFSAESTSKSNVKAATDADIKLVKEAVQEYLLNYAQYLDHVLNTGVEENKAGK